MLFLAHSITRVNDGKFKADVGADTGGSCAASMWGPVWPNRRHRGFANPRPLQHMPASIYQAVIVPTGCSGAPVSLTRLPDTVTAPRGLLFYT